MTSFADRCGPAPFNVITDKHNVLIAAADGTLFPATMEIPGDASPVLWENYQELLASPETISYCDGLPILPTKDAPYVVFHVLGVCMPGPYRIGAVDAVRIFTIVKALLRYRVRGVLGSRYFAQLLRVDTPEDALQAYALTLSHFWAEGMRITAEACLRVKAVTVYNDIHTHPAFNDTIQILDPGRLVKFRGARVDAMTALFKGVAGRRSLLWLQQFDLAFFECTHSPRKHHFVVNNRFDSVCAPTWFVDLCDALCTALREVPVPETVEGFCIPPTLKKEFCKPCGHRLRGDLKRFMTDLKAEAEKVKTRIQLDTTFAPDVVALFLARQK
ncbi:hypothetical protein PsYK624_156370 [Phanerochaete sordida]|uniref:Uncharacterized protein n=1 Tax=Phanerochaete sordida TaxID=48140 RepID=A0A9P3GQT5_9APHY|nr:hypothetical protein PsYK624_156370 [Phanerochaete sordida]